MWDSEGVFNAWLSKPSWCSVPVHEQGFECLDLPLVGVSASFTDKLLYNKPVRSRGTDGLSPWCGAGNYSRSFSKEGSELLGRAKCIPSAACRVPPTCCVCGSSDRGRTPRLLLHGDARGFGVVIFGFREGEHQLTFQRLVPQRSCPRQPLPVSSEVSFLELDLVRHTGII